MHIKVFVIFLSPIFLVVTSPVVPIGKRVVRRRRKISNQVISHLFTALGSSLVAEKVQVADF